MAGTRGDFDRFAHAFPNDLVPSVIRFMLAEWPNAPRPRENPLENRITNRFVGHLRRVLRSYEMPQFSFEYRPKVADPDSDVEAGELDISVRSFSPHPDALLVIECKRLNLETESGFRSLAGEYVGDQGMGCFINGQYQSGGNVGAMLGYVMTRTIGDAVDSINQRLVGRRAELQLQEPHELQESAILPGQPNVRQTNHLVAHSDFAILHVLVMF